MPLATQIVSIPLTGGVDEKTRAELLDPGSFTTLSNFQYGKSNALAKRPGVASVPTTLFAGGSLSAGERLLGYRDELVAVDGGQLVSRGATVNALAGQGPIVGEALVTRLAVASLGLDCAQYDIIEANGYRAIAWAVPVSAGGGLGIYIVIVDIANNAIVVSPTLVGGGGAGDLTVSFSLAAIGSRIIVLWGLRGSGSIASTFFDTSATGGIGGLASGGQGGGTVATDAYNSASEPPYFDVCTLDDRIAIAYANNAGSNTLTVRTLNFVFNTLTQIAQTIFGSANGADLPTTMALGGSQTDTLFLAYPVTKSSSNNVSVSGLNPLTLANAGTGAVVITTTATFPAQLGIVRTGAASGYLVAGDSDENLHSRPFNVQAGNVVALSSTVVRNFLLADSRPFVVGGRPYVMVRPNVPTGINRQYVCVDLSGGAASLLLSGGPYLRPAATVSPRLAVSPSQIYGMPAHVCVSGGGTKIVVANIAARTGSSAGLEMATLDFAAPSRWMGASFAETMCLSGGVPSYYDGSRVSEQGFILAPTTVTFTMVTSGALSPTTGYLYVAVYEQFDARGQRHQSAPSQPSAVAKPSAQNVRLSTTPLSITGRVSSNNTTSPTIRIAWYRTVDGGTVYYRLPNAEVVNNNSAATAIFVDSTSDATLATQEPLYTQPGSLGTAQPKVSPPSFVHHVQHGDRLVGINGSDVWVSGQQIYGEGVWWSDKFVYPQTGGDLTAVWSMDGRIIAFGRARIIFLDGDGPPDNGGGGDYVSQNIATPVGCTEPRSLVTIPSGTVFRSLRGLELLTRGMQVQEPFFGRHVESTLAAFPIITSATNREDLGRVVFTCVATEGAATGTTIEYDYVHDTWGPCPRGDGSAPGTGIASAAIVGTQPGTTPRFTYLTPAGAIFQESAATFLDAGAWVTSSFETAWIKVGGLQGFQRLRHVLLLAQMLTPHDLTLQLAFDYSASYTETHTRTAAQIALQPAGEWMDFHVANQRCTAVRLKFTDLTPTSGVIGTGQGGTILGLALEIGVKQGRARLPALAKG